MRDLSKFEFLNLARPTRFQFITFRSFFLLSFGYGRMEENISKRISSFINFLRKQIHLLPPPLSVFLPPNHAIRIETITIPSPPIPVPFPSRTFLSSLPPESGGISAQDVFFTPTVCPTCHRPKLPPRDPCCQRASPDFSSPLFLRIFRSLPRGKGGKTRVQPAFRAVPNKCI